MKLTSYVLLERTTGDREAWKDLSNFAVKIVFIVTWEVTIDFIVKKMLISYRVEGMCWITFESKENAKLIEEMFGFLLTGMLRFLNVINMID